MSQQTPDSIPSFGSTSSINHKDASATPPSPAAPSNSAAAAGSGPYANPSHLFTLRVWQEEIESDRQEWRGRIHHVESNQTRYFRDWSALIPVLLAMVRQTPGAECNPAALFASSKPTDDAQATSLGTPSRGDAADPH